MTIPHIRPTCRATSTVLSLDLARVCRRWDNGTTTRRIEVHEVDAAERTRLGWWDYAVCEHCRCLHDATVRICWSSHADDGYPEEDDTCTGCAADVLDRLVLPDVHRFAPVEVLIGVDRPAPMAVAA